MKRIRPLFENVPRTPLACIVVAVLLFCTLPPAAGQSQTGSEGSSQSQLSTPVAGTDQSTSELYRNLAVSFEKAIETENNKLRTISRKLEAATGEEDTTETRYDEIQLMTSAHSNLLLLPAMDLKSLDQAHTRQTVAIGYVKERLEKIEEELSDLKISRQETADQLRFYERQLEEVRPTTAQVPTNEDLVGNLKTLVDITRTRQEMNEQVTDIYHSRLERFNSLLSDLKILAAKFEKQIADKKKSRILHHNMSPLVRLYKGELKNNILDAAKQVRKLWSPEAWRKPAAVTWEEYGVFLATFLVFFGLLEGIIYGFAKFCGRIKQRCLDVDKYWQYMLLKLVQRSLPIAGAIAYLSFFPVRPVYQLSPVFVLLPLIIRILLLLMVIQWGMVFLRTLGGRTDDHLFHSIYWPLRQLLIGIMVFGAGHLCISRIICDSCIGLIAWRMLFEFMLLGWGIYFFRIFRRQSSDSDIANHPWFPVIKPSVITLGYGFILVGVLAELTGFGGLAIYWYYSLGRTAVVFFWAYILFRLLYESDVSAHIERSDDIDEDELPDQPYPVRWLVVRLLRLAVCLAIILTLPLAWGAPRNFMANVFYAINYNVTIGTFNLSLMGFVYALIVLLVVHTIVVITKEILRGRILRDADLEKGLKDSIIRITGYVLWLIGILITLRVVGISATSLTVVFGALGIGLGFGLQNIFNNFLSGIILLFERPIQVGDVIEIGNVWGTVREINVRSTQVRTFDNADLIIPNSDFISQRLTNWSFRDARVRRTVVVGVAYGSDINLVREILIDVAYQHPRILRRPHPEVLFSDFGESALIFKLRFWVHIDWFLIVETDVRFDVDKRFKENHITIPFPQRDLHFKGPLPPAGDQVSAAANEISGNAGAETVTE